MLVCIQPFSSEACRGFAQKCLCCRMAVIVFIDLINIPFVYKMSQNRKKTQQIVLYINLEACPTLLTHKPFVVESWSGVALLGTDYVPATKCQLNQIHFIHFI